MSYIAVYRDWNKQRVNFCPKVIRSVNGYGWLAKPRRGQVIVIEHANFSAYLSTGTATNIANVGLMIADADGNSSPVALTGVNTGVSATVCSVSGGGLVVNAYVGMLLRYKTGVNAGKVRLISANAAGTITTATFTTAPANLDEFEVINQGSFNPILPSWRMRRSATVPLSVNYQHKDVEIVLGDSAGIGYLTRQGTVGPDVYIEPTSFSISLQLRYEPQGYKSTISNYQIQPSGAA